MQPEEQAKPISLTDPPPPATPAAPPDTFSHLITAGIFFALGFLLAGLIGFSIGGDGGTPSEQAVANAVQATMTALVPTDAPTPTAVPVELTFSSLDYSRGAEDAPVTLVEFSDYRCPYCERFALTTLQQLMAHYDGYLRFVYRDYPIFGDESVTAAHAARCAADQDKFWDYHDVLFASQSQEPRATFDNPTLLAMATQLSLDTDAFESCLNSSQVADGLVSNIQNAYALMGQAPTPTFLLNGKRFAGALPLENFIQLIDAELIAQGIEPPA